MEGVRLNNTRIEQLVDQLYGLNRTLVGYEGKLLRLVTDCKVSREEFLQHYFGYEHEPSWLERVSSLSPKWSRFSEKSGAQAQAVRAEIKGLADRAGLPVPEFRRIVQTVQKGEKEASRAKKEMVEANLRLDHHLLGAGCLQIGRAHV